jgi:predicted ArsR family transcriptional regulator
MGRNFETKREIVESLVTHRRTLTDLSRYLGLTPSTVKQHLDELRAMGMVQFVDDIHLTKFKYYETVPGISLGGHIDVTSTSSGRKVAIVKPILARQYR